jgi:hypothetical protein
MQETFALKMQLSAAEDAKTSGNLGKDTEIQKLKEEIFQLRSNDIIEGARGNPEHSAEISKLQQENKLLDGVVKLEQEEKKLIAASLQENMALTAKVSEQLKKLTKSIQQVEGDKFAEKKKFEEKIEKLNEEIAQWQDYWADGKEEAIEEDEAEDEETVVAEEGSAPTEAAVAAPLPATEAATGTAEFRIHTPPPPATAGAEAETPSPASAWHQPYSKEANYLKFEAFPNAAGWRAWKRRFLDKIKAAPANPREAYKWILIVNDMTWEQLCTAEKLGVFDTLNTKIASALHEILSGEFQRKIINADEKNVAEFQETLTGRQIYFLIMSHFEINDIDSHCKDW